MVVYRFTYNFPFLGYCLQQRTKTHNSFLGRKTPMSLTNTDLKIVDVRAFKMY